MMPKTATTSTTFKKQKKLALDVSLILIKTLRYSIVCWFLTEIMRNNDSITGTLSCCLLFLLSLTFLHGTFVW